MGRNEQVLEAVEAVIQKRVEGLDKKITNEKMQAVARGAAGSRMFLLLAEICRDEFSEIAQDISRVIERYDAPNASDYGNAFYKLLDGAREKVMTTFTSQNSRMGEGAQKWLERELSVAMKNAVREFDLTVTVPTKTDDTDLALAFLRYYSKVPKAHKSNVLGQSYQPGALETELGRNFTPEERSQAGRVQEGLIKDGLLEPTYDDMVDPEKWLRITEAGRSAEKSGAPDDLDLKLMKINPHLVTRRRGAWAAAASDHPDAPSQAAHSGRELVSHLLAELAPIDEIKAQLKFEPAKDSKTGVTRRMQIKYAMTKRPSGSSESDLAIAKSAAGLLDALHTKLSALTHGRDPSITAVEVKTVLSGTDMILQLLLS